MQTGLPIINKIHRLIRRQRALFLVSLIALTAYGCDGFYFTDFDKLKAKFNTRTIRVVTLESPVSFDTHSEELKGIDYDLMKNFADTMGAKVQFVLAANEESALDMLRDGRVDVAAARLRTPYYIDNFYVGPAYETTQYDVYCRRQLKVFGREQIADKTIVALSKDQSPDMQELFASELRGAKLKTLTESATTKAIRKVLNKETDCVVAEAAELRAYARHFSTLEKSFSLSRRFSLQWLVSEHTPDLNIALKLWYQKAAREGIITTVQDRYKGHLYDLSFHDVNKLNRDIREQLPTYLGLFKSAAKDVDLPWQLLAAVAYQESHWDHSAQSFTGVRGLMQLTEDTAAHMGVDDRTDPKQSVNGGSKYLRELMGMIPGNIHSRDRLSIALAAYNVGPMHLRDAQELAIRLGKNPWSWTDLKTVLPLLGNSRFEKYLKHGLARGDEPVVFVDRVRNFYEILEARM